MLLCSCLDHPFLHVYNYANFHWVYVALHLKSFVYFTLHLLSHVCLLVSFIQWSTSTFFMFSQISFHVPSTSSSPSCIPSLHMHIPTAYLSSISFTSWQTDFSFLAALIQGLFWCHVAGNSYICIILYIIHTRQPSFSVFYLKIQPLITSLSTMHSFVIESLLDQLVEVIY